MAKLETVEVRFKDPDEDARVGKSFHINKTDFDADIHKLAKIPLKKPTSKKAAARKSAKKPSKKKATSEGSK